MSEKVFWGVTVGGGILVVIGIIALLMWGLPTYGVWAAEMNGRAQLSEADYSKQVQVATAEANVEAEKLNAQAEVERARGAAEARNVEGLGMTADEYIQYLWVKKLSLADSAIIYLPTEGGIPVMTTDATNPTNGLVFEGTDENKDDTAAEQQEETSD